MSVSQPTHAGEKLHSAASIRLPFFRSATQSTHRDFATLRGVYLRTKNGAQGIKDAVEAVRATNTDRDERAKLKKRLPAVSYSVASFDGGHRSANDAARHTGLFQVDFDHVETHGLAVGDLRETMRGYPHAAFCFVSPSGDGLKVIVAAEISQDKRESLADAHAAHYHAVAQNVADYVHAKTGVALEYDRACKDISRLCFLSYDPGAWMRESVEPLRPDRTPDNKASAKPKRDARGRITKATDETETPAEATEGPEAEAAAFFLLADRETIADNRRLDLYTVGSQCFDFGLSRSAAVRVAERVNQTFYTPPKSGAEVAGQVFDAYRYAKGVFGSRSRLLADTIRRQKEKQAKQTVRINARYIDAAQIGASSARVVLVESVQGTGKTTAIKKLTAQATATGQKVIYIAHRVALLRQMSDALRLAFYKALGLPEWQKSPSLVITPNSLHRLSTEHYAGAVVIIDEVDQVFSDLCGSTCRKKRPEIVGALHRLLNGAEKVYAMSADITQPVKNLFAARGDAVEFFRNEWRPTRTAQQYKQAPDLLAAVLSDVKKGQRVAVACDSKARAKRIHRILTDAHPTKNFFLITEENSQGEAAQKLFADPRGFAAFDGVIYSPAMGSGVDIDIDFSPVQYLFAGGGSSSAPELLQMACRFRRWDTLRFWVTPKTLKGRTRQPVTRDEVLNIWQRNLKDFTELYYPDIDTGKPQPLAGYAWAINLAADVTAEKNDSHNDIAGAFAYVLREKGYSIKTADAKTVSEPERAQASAAEKDARKMIKAEYVAAVLDKSNDIEEAEAERLESDGVQCEADKVKLDRHFYKRAAETDDAATLERAVTVTVETLRERVRAFSTFHDLPQDIAAKDRATHTGFLPDHRFDALKARMRQAVEAELRFLSEPGREFFTDSEPQSAELRDVIERHRDSISRHLFAVTASMIEKPALFLRTFYGQAGLSLAVRKQGKDRARVYRIDADSLAFMWGISGRRRERLAREAAQAAEAARQAAAADAFDWL